MATLVNTYMTEVVMPGQQDGWLSAPQAPAPEVSSVLRCCAQAACEAGLSAKGTALHVGLQVVNSQQGYQQAGSPAQQWALKPSPESIHFQHVADKHSLPEEPSPQISAWRGDQLEALHAASFSSDDLRSCGKPSCPQGADGCHITQRTHSITHSMVCLVAPLRR